MKAMTEPTEDLWPNDVAAPPGEKLPVVILREQAALLGAKTKNLVEAEIASEPADRGLLLHRFFLRAPALSNYRYQLFYMMQPIEGYPVRVSFSEFSPDREAHSAQDLLACLRTIFAADSTRRVIGALVAQSAA
jgi:hypothetical protein